ncbi:MAG TPA: hypothetical protein RMH99_14320 [Sandaracinaceae bacterium LLY-WYZ-13_1]|nr:hypothetical protein [Sandaracinaceae bacterium LLY-WYZ-13_1]
MERDSDSPTSDAPSTSRRRWGALWLALLGVAIVELVGHFVVQARVVPDDDWARAAGLVRRAHRPGDLIVAAPGWADPLVRQALGDLIEPAEAGRSDLAGYERLWALSIRGHRPEEAPDAPAELDRAVGAVRVLRWRLPSEPVLYDFTEHVREARVTLGTGDGARRCTWRRTGRPRGGGLGAGPIQPAERHVCDPRRSWLWVGTTIQDDLDLSPRYCIWQHPAGREPIRATFPGVPLGERLVLYGDVYYEHERHEEHGPVHVTVSVNGEPVGRMTHRDGDGWKRMEASTEVPGAGARGEVTVEVTAPNPHLRTFCWAATTRGSDE